MAGVYLVKGDDELVPMSEEPYITEDVLQSLLAKHPDLLAGDQIDSAAPRRWLLISREVPLPGEEDGAWRWTVDHLFLDQDAVPTLVEVKRSTDTRMRREVVGQMLDYAANAVAYWPVATIRASFEARCAASGLAPDQELGALLGDDEDVEEFWQKAKTNLQAGRVRLIFVADRIPAELRRVVEFLSKQMDPAQVLAVEIKQYVGPGHTTLVPRVVGMTEKVSDQPHGRQWTWELFKQELAKRDASAVPIAEGLRGWMGTRDLEESWGRGSQYGSFSPHLRHNGVDHSPFSAWTFGTVQVSFGMMRTRPPFEDEAKRLELLQMLNRIPGVSIADDGIHRYPSLPLSKLGDQAALAQFLAAFDWYLEQVSAA